MKRLISFVAFSNDPFAPEKLTKFSSEVQSNSYNEEHAVALFKDYSKMYATYLKDKQLYGYSMSFVVYDDETGETTPIPNCFEKRFAVPQKKTVLNTTKEDPKKIMYQKPAWVDQAAWDTALEMLSSEPWKNNAQTNATY